MSTENTQDSKQPAIPPLLPATGSPSVDFCRAAQWSDACLEGSDAAREMRLPKISDRWARPDLKDAWLHGFTTEIRNRMENAEMSESARDNPKR